MKRAFKFDQRLFYSGKRRILWLQQAKAVIETHPNVFDLKSMFTTIITRLWNYTPRGQMSGLIKKINVFSSLSLEQKWRSLTDTYCGHTQLWPKPQLPIWPRISPRQKGERGYSLRWQKWTMVSLLKDVSRTGSVTSGIVNLPSQSIPSLWGEQQGSRTINGLPLNVLKAFWVTAYNGNSTSISKDSKHIIYGRQLPFQIVLLTNPSRSSNFRAIVQSGDAMVARSCSSGSKLYTRLRDINFNLGRMHVHSTVAAPWEGHYY